MPTRRSGGGTWGTVTLKSGWGTERESIQVGARAGSEGACLSQMQGSQCRGRGHQRVYSGRHGDLTKKEEEEKKTL